MDNFVRNNLLSINVVLVTEQC